MIQLNLFHRCVHMMDGKFNDETIDPSLRTKGGISWFNDTDGIPTSVIVEQQQEERIKFNQPILMKNN